MLSIDGKYYKIDMDAVMAWVVETPSAEKNINVITQFSYPAVDNEDIVEKDITENKSTLNDTLNNIRYDFVRALLNNILIMTSDASGNIITQHSIEEFSIGQKIAFNSLLDKKIIIEVTDFNNE